MAQAKAGQGKIKRGDRKNLVSREGKAIGKVL